MTARHRVYWPAPADLYREAHDKAATVVVDTAAGEAVCVVDEGRVEWRARLAVGA